MSDEEVITQEMVDEEVHECARFGEVDEFKTMVASDDTGMVNFNVLDKEGNCALHKAAANNHVEMMKYLVENKAQYILNNNKVGPLTWAVLNRHVEACTYLLETFSDEIDVVTPPTVGLSLLSTAYDVESEEITNMFLVHPSIVKLDEVEGLNQVDLDEGDDDIGEETPIPTEEN